MAKTKRLKMIFAGRLVRGVVYTAPLPRDTLCARQSKQKISSKARMLINQKASFQKLKLEIATNFSMSDLHVVLTYDDAHLPQTKLQAVKNVKKFLVQLRRHRKLRQQTLKYIYVTESKHENGRFHHHLILNGTGADLELIKSLWVHGDNVNLETLDVYGYTAISQYLTKEPKEFGRAKVGERMWTCSKNLEKPYVESGWVDDITSLTPPPGVTVLERETQQNEFGEYSYIEYLLPEPQARKTRPSRRKKE